MVVAVDAQQLQVVPAQGDARVVDVVRRQRRDVVNLVTGLVQAAGQATLTQAVDAGLVIPATTLPGAGAVEACGELFVGKARRSSRAQSLPSTNPVACAPLPRGG